MDIARPIYHDGHRAFLQAILARGTLTFEEARPIIAAIVTENDGGEEVAPEDVALEDFQGFIAETADAVAAFDYEIRHTVHQKTKERIYALVNTTSDPTTQLATTFSADEISFIKRVLDTMFDVLNTPRMEIMSLTAQQAIPLGRPRNIQANEGEASQSQASSDRGITHSEVHRVLGDLVAGGWLEKSREQFFSLSPRALLELRPMLVENYNDPDAGDEEWQRIKFCHACKEIITDGQRCAERDCNIRLHDICEDAFWRTRMDRSCPGCTLPWSGTHFVGERAVTSTKRYQQGRGRGRKSNLADDIFRRETAGDSP